MKSLFGGGKLVCKKHFALWTSVERTMDSSNVIGGKQKFVRPAFTLEANSQRTMPNGQCPPKCLHGSTFRRFLVPRVCLVEENLSMIFMETQTLLEQTSYFSLKYLKSKKI
jgi:hypothetical protein